MTAQLDRQIQWYPGHMAAAMRRVEQLIRLIDVVIEVVDARVPRSGVSPMLSKIGGRRPRLIVLTREDLADPQTTVKWLTYFQQLGQPAIAVNAKQRKSVKLIMTELHRLTAGTKGAERRAIVVGIPNSGKSTVINALCGRAVAATENRPGRTRGVQWFRLDQRLELMDTPGILAPKIESVQSQWMLAITGAIPAQRYDPEEVVALFTACTTWLRRHDAQAARIPDLNEFARRRGMASKDGSLHNAARSFIKSLNEGAFGRISFEVPPHD